MPPPRKRKEKVSGFSAEPRRVVIKFRDSCGLPYKDYIDSPPPLMDNKLGDWNKLVSACKVSGLELRRLLPSIAPERIQALATYQPTPPDFLSYFAVSCPSGVNPEDVIEIAKSWDIDTERPPYLEARTVRYTKPPDALRRAVRPRGAPLQGYLEPASSGGIDARFAHRKDGGEGQGVVFADLEQGWEFDADDKHRRVFHEDLPSGIELLGCNHDYHDHGTACLGIVVGQGKKGKKSCLGIAPKAKTVCVSQYGSGEVHPTCGSSIPDAISRAINYFLHHEPNESQGTRGVLLVEAQLEDQGGYLAVEAEHAIFEQIRCANANGIVVVEPAGDGGRDLSMLTEDSGAILVGAIDSRRGVRIPGSNYGKHVDCWAWGNNVYTTGNGGQEGSGGRGYTPNFDGTSAAAAIIAGAAVAIVGIARANNRRLTPADVRNLLRSTISDRGIGRTPDLRNIIESEMPDAKARRD